MDSSVTSCATFLPDSFDTYHSAQQIHSLTENHRDSYLHLYQSLPEQFVHREGSYRSGSLPDSPILEIFQDLKLPPINPRNSYSRKSWSTFSPSATSNSYPWSNEMQLPGIRNLLAVAQYTQFEPCIENPFRSLLHDHIETYRPPHPQTGVSEGIFLEDRVHFFKLPAQTHSRAVGGRNKRHVCGVCQKRFTRPSSLKIHILSHTGEKPYACDMLGCNKKFSVLSNLRRHYKVHFST